MKKFFLSLVAATMAATASFAQSSMLATLSHNGEISTFYGATALRDAYNAAEHGDIITLSSGSFAAVDINKALTIRGAGMQVDTVAKTYPTVIAGNFTINIPDSIDQRLTMEGIYNNFTITVKGTLKNASFLKDRLGSIISSASSDRMKNLTFIHCQIAACFLLPSESSASCVNCFVNNANSESATSSNFEFTNCVINNIGTSYYYRKTYFYTHLLNIKSSTFNNCIIYSNYYSYASTSDILDSSCSAFYCVGKINSTSYNIFSNIPNTTNTRLTDNLNTLFKTYTGTYNDNETFELTTEAKTKYKGSDGTEVGIYGGSLPFDPTPTNPQITKCNVASKSTADGKLSVDIEVSAAE